MSLDIFVQRDDGSSIGQDIVNALLSGLAPALQRGRNELDENGGYFDEVTLTLPLLLGIQDGMLLQVYDSEFGVAWFGKITRVSHSMDGASQGTSLTILRKK